MTDAGIRSADGTVKERIVNARAVFGFATLSLLTIGSAAHAAQYRIYFVGSEARAIQSASMVRPAGYVGVPAAADPANLSVPAAPTAVCPTPGACPAPSSQYHGAGTPNQIVTFLHPYTNQAITIPLTLPVGRPKIVTKSDRIIYDYGLFSHKVIVKFLPNGLVEVIYRG
jgi:hypothetical protein